MDTSRTAKYYHDHIKEKLRWAEHATRIQGKGNVYEILVGKLKERDNLEGLDVDGIMIFLKWILNGLGAFEQK
jgi:hypothetical protein